jgi:endonuclease-3
MTTGDKNKRRVGKLITSLKKRYPDARCSLNFKSPLELLIATVLSAQCTDVRVNIVTKELFRKYRRAEDYARVRPEILEDDIRSTGFYKNKTKSIINCCKKISQNHGGTALTENQDPVKIEYDLMALVPEKEWTHFSHLIIFHGRNTCVARKPHCEECVIEPHCPKVGVAR